MRPQALLEEVKHTPAFKEENSLISWFDSGGAFCLPTRIPSDSSDVVAAPFAAREILSAYHKLSSSSSGSSSGTGSPFQGHLDVAVAIPPAPPSSPNNTPATVQI